VAKQAQSFYSIRSWEGSQDRAFEELCYQLRDPTPDGADLWKLGNPDGGYEWFVRHANGVEWGWQAKFTSDIDTALKLMEVSLKTVTVKRPRCRRLTFCIPFDLPDSPDEGKRKSARQKFIDRKRSWRERIPGADRIKIELWQAGDLVERLAKPEHRGMAWFFWDEEVFGPDWCQARLKVTADIAGARYTPALNVDLPIAFSLEGLARSGAFLTRFQQRRGAFVKAARRIKQGGYSGLGVSKELRALAHALAAAEDALPRSGVVDGQFPRTTMLDGLQACWPLISAADPGRSPQDGSDRERERIGSLRYRLGQVSQRLSELEAFLGSPAAQAAEQGVLVMTGMAGQGKTHLFCDAGKRAIDGGRSVAVLLGQQFTGARVVADIAERLGLPQRGASELFGAMRAAAEASGTPFLLLIDALNDSGDPHGWRSELPSLLAEVAQHAPWIVVGVSIRTSYLDIIADSTINTLPTIDHPGFAGHEHEAAQRFFEVFKLQQPRIPLLLPEFTNPLFLRLYCEAVQASGAPAPELGHAHISDVFTRYIESKNRQISLALKLDPSANKVGAAIEAFASALAGAPREWLPREEASAIIDSHASHLQAWPNTLFGQLLAEGILTTDIGYRTTESGDWESLDTARITFQRLGDYRIAGSMLARLETPTQLKNALKAGQRLREQVLAARAGIIEALAVLLPERFGVELLDAARWNLRDRRRERWHQATLSSIASRRDDAATERTIELVREISGRSRHLFEQATSVLVTVAARPDHALNAEFLHAALSRWPMPARDASWGITTYNWLDQTGPLDQLVRWAAAAPYPDYPDEVIELASIPLTWLLASPNRVMRDYVTKVLCQLLSQRLAVLHRLLERFRAVDDPYVKQRLAVITHGAILLGGSADPTKARECSRLLAEIVLAGEPDILARDAARGAMEWCLSAGLAGNADYEAVSPPYASEPPVRPRTFKQLKRAYDKASATRVDPQYSSLFFSIFEMGDFGRYVIESKVHYFTRFPLGKPLPPKRPRRRSKPNPAMLAQLEQSLAPEHLQAAEEGDLLGLIGELSVEEYRALLAAFEPSRPVPPQEYPADLAQRWVFERVLSLGWTPEQFARFDQNYAFDTRAGRSGHKAERFGKKYQWIAIHELLARIADNFHMRSWGDDAGVYHGPWQFFGRHIDPTLPPARRTRDDDGVERLSETFRPDAEGAWWIPPGPQYTGDQPPARAGWAESTADIPEMESLVLRRDGNGNQWVVLHGYYNWDEQLAADQERDDRDRRDMWSHIYGWIVRESDTERLRTFLQERSFMGRWMPEGREISDAAYLPEIPWAAAANEYPPEWELVEPHGDDDPAGVAVYPAWSEYMWEGNIWDCSIDDSVYAMSPAAELFEAGELQWQIGTREWIDSAGVVVAQYRETSINRRSVLLVRQDWLLPILRSRKWSLVVGWLGEKQLFGAGFSSGLVGGWSEMNGVAVLHRGNWVFAPRRIQVQRA
jgi:hypothetical protein